MCTFVIRVHLTSSVYAVLLSLLVMKWSLRLSDTFTEMSRDSLSTALAVVANSCIAPCLRSVPTSRCMTYRSVATKWSTFSKPRVADYT